MPSPGSSAAQRHVPIDVPYSSSAATTRKTPAYAARNRERLCAGEGKQRSQGGEQQEPGQRAEGELAVQADLRVDREQGSEVRGAGGCVPPRQLHRRYWTSCQLGVGSSSRSARPPFGSWYENSAVLSSKPTSSFPSFTR